MGETAFQDTPSGIRALPGDVLPPFGQIDPDGTFHATPRDVPAGFNLGPNRPPESIARGPSLAVAITAAEAALNTCRHSGYRVGVAVIDTEGKVRVLLNADGTDGSHGFVAMRKAEAALAFNMPSSEVNDLAQSDKSVLKRVTLSMLLDGGAVPLHVGSTLVGAIGVSGSAGKIIGAQDEVCARAGRDAFAAQQK
ncbi:heme-binding protein [Rouxiella badensis]|nr:MULTISPECIES: heme-binding protein [Yersiniaceae]MCC3705228.1 heme-binding protein [Rouxiella badensis]MCC3735711.1 heme-binding protein [Rouxiella badensis]MCC3742593.1 heme-binding protein [Rouxiella badensis]MCC3761077.1 heme-binding protein [Rouxiella badensis]